MKQLHIYPEKRQISNSPGSRVIDRPLHTSLPHRLSFSPFAFVVQFLLLEPQLACVYPAERDPSVMVMDTKDTTERQARETQQHSMPEFATRNKLSCVSCASTIVPEDEQCVPAGSSPNSPNLNEKEEQEEVELREDNHSEGGHVPSEPELYMLETKNVVAFSDGDSDNPYNWSTV